MALRMGGRGSTLFFARVLVLVMVSTLLLPCPALSCVSRPCPTSSAMRCTRWRSSFSSVDGKAKEKVGEGLESTNSQMTRTLLLVPSYTGGGCNERECLW